MERIIAVHEPAEVVIVTTYPAPSEIGEVASTEIVLVSDERIEHVEVAHQGPAGASGLDKESNLNLYLIYQTAKL